MRWAGGLCLAVLVASAGYSQRITRNFGSVVFPGGATNSSPTITRNFGSAVFPGGSPTSPIVGGGPGRIVAPSGFQHPGVAGAPFRNGPAVTPFTGFGNGAGFGNGGGFGRGFNNSFGNSFNNGSRRDGKGRGRNDNTFFYPIFVGGGYGGYGYGGGYDSAPFAPDTIAMQPPLAMAPPQQQSGVTTIYPQQPQQGQGGGTIIELRPDGTYVRRQSMPQPYGMAPQAYADADTEPPTQDPANPSHFMIAFKDHTVYSAVAYWFEGETLHYFTNGSTHNQVSVSLIDRPLTERLNREMGIEFKMPAGK